MAPKGLDASSGAFWRSVGVVLSGSVLAQSIPLLGSLLITRIYAPAEFGAFSAWLGLVMLAAVVVTGRFEMALAVEPDGAPRRFAVWATLVTVGLLSMALSALAALAWVGGLFPEAVTLWPALLAFPATALVGLTHTWQAWAAADGNYRSLSWIRVAQALVVTLSQIAAGLLAPTAVGMMLGHVLGLAAGVGCALAAMPLGRPRARAATWQRLRQFWHRQRRFPLLALPADTLNAAAGQLPLLLIASRFGAEAGGQFALTLRVLGAPIGLLGAAILDVFKRTAASSYRDKGHCREEYARTFWLLAAGGVALALGVLLLADRVFVLAFGDAWRQAGTIAVWLVPMFAMRFVASPLSYVFYIAGKQHVDLLWQCTLLSMTVTAFMLPSAFPAAVQLYAAGYGLLYLVYLLLSYRYSLGRPAP